MNIFALHSDPRLAATYLCDGHVIKMTLESAQILSTVARRLNLSQEPSLYRPTHERHPCVQWAGSSPSNYEWLLEHFMHLCYQYSRRYNKQHKCFQLLPHFQVAAAEFYRTGRPLSPQPFALAMPEYCKVRVPQRREDLNLVAAVWSYRNYYWNEKLGKIKLSTYFQQEYPNRAGRGTGWVEQFLQFARYFRIAEPTTLSPSFSNESLQVTTKTVLLIRSEDLEALSRVVRV